MVEYLEKIIFFLINLTFFLFSCRVTPSFLSPHVKFFSKIKFGNYSFLLNIFLIKKTYFLRRLQKWFELNWWMEPNDGRNGRKIGSGPRPEACSGDKCGPGLRGQNEDEKGIQPPHCQAFKIKITPNNSRRLRLKRPFTLFVNPVTVFHNYHSSHTILEWKFLFSLQHPITFPCIYEKANQSCFNLNYMDGVIVHILIWIEVENE